MRASAVSMPGSGVFSGGRRSSDPRAYGKLRQAGVGGDALVDGFAETGIEIRPFDAEDARLAGELVGLTRKAGLSLADRACLALAGRLGVPAVTADRTWLSLDIGVEVIGIR